MPVYIALYRGLNVGGKTTVKMEALRAVHEGLGHRGVKNYIQSGNIVFVSDDSVEDLIKACSVGFARAFNFSSRVLIVDADRWAEIIIENPYSAEAAEDPKTVHVGVCIGRPDVERMSALLAKTGGPESFQIRDDVVYLHAPEGLGRSKFAEGVEKASGVPMTMRNWRTVEALQELAETIEAG